MRFIVILFTISVFFSSCSNNNETNELTTTHPTPSNLITDSNMISSLDIKNVELGQEYSGLLDLLINMDTEYSVETSYHSNSDRLIGMIDDLSIMSSGEMFILDAKQFKVHQFDSNGVFTRSIGRQGSGPGEFMNPEKIMVYDDSLLLVSDVTKIEIFDITHETKYVETVSLKNGVSSMCSIGDTLYTFSNMFLHHNQNNNDDEKIDLIHAYDINDFNYLYSFGKPYQSSYPDIVQRLSAGNIVCNTESKTVSFLFQYVPVLNSYSATDGSLKWSMHFEELSLPKVSTRLNDGRIRFRYSTNENINDFFFEPLSLKGPYILVQLRRSYKEDNSESYNVTYVIDSRTGEGKYVSQSIPHIMSISGQYLSTRDIYSNDLPFAKLMKINNTN